MKVNKAIKNHGPCDNCGEDIEPGQTYHRHPRVATPQERDDPNVRTWFWQGKGVLVSVKRHTGCHRPDRQPTTRSLGSLLP